MKDYTEIVVVMDKSGSMEETKTDAIGGFNSFLNDQINTPGKAKLSLVLFDSCGNYNMKYNGVKLQDVEKFNESNYIPGGMTALLDAIGRTIDDVGRRLKDTEESKRPSKVIFVIITDGQENNSQEYNRKQIFDKIELQKNIYKWEFIFVGSNQDAIKEGGSIGIHKTATYDPTNIGTMSAFMAVSSSVSGYRTTGNIGNIQDNYNKAMNKSNSKTK